MIVKSKVIDSKESFSPVDRLIICGNGDMKFVLRRVNKNLVLFTSA